MAKKGSILLNFLNLPPKKIYSIVDYFQDINSVFKAKESHLRDIPTLTQKDVDIVLKIRDSNALDRELGLLEQESITCIDIFDFAYPYLLKEIANPPLVLYVKGELRVLDGYLFAIVGSRNPTNYGLAVARYFSAALVSLGMVITSGLAKGIDSAVHEAAIGKGESVAVLGSGLLNIYPKENRGLAKSVREKGVLISEFALLTPPSKENFPRRNRIVSGLCKGVLVVEAACRSGALITARLACEQNREVFAIPGNMDSLLSKGTNFLIKEGAKLVDSLEDILSELNVDSRKLNRLISEENFCRAISS